MKIFSRIFLPFLLGAVAIALFGPEVRTAALLAVPWAALLPAVLQGGASILGGLINKKANPKPKYPDLEPPDLTDPVSAIFDRQRSKLAGSVNERTDRAEATAAAQNLSASGYATMMDPVFRSNADAMVDLSVQEAQAMNEAQRQEEMMKYEAETQQKLGQYDADMQAWQNRAQGIGGIVGAVGSGAQNYLDMRMLDKLMQNQESMTTSDPMNPIMPFLTMDYSKQGIASRSVKGLTN